MAVLFALLAAAAYGVSDFVGGLASRRIPAVTVLLASYPIGTVLMAALLPVYGGPVSAGTLAWSLAGGAAGLVGVALLYTALGQAPMNVISPVTAVMTAVVPIVAGVLQGERPHLLAWLGILLGLATMAGILDGVANLAFLLASRHGLLSLSSVITALYPAGTVLLAVLMLKERTGAVQRVGLGVAAAAVVLLTR
jgi:drug/metabolite transporter (DMT)-like permease